jgi:hypothetical protein
MFPSRTSSAAFPTFSLTSIITWPPLLMAPQTFPERNNPERKNPERNNPNLFSGIYVKILNPEKGLRKGKGT